MKPVSSSKNQKGVAVVTVLLLTVLCLSIVTSLFWEQQVQVRSIENQRLQLQQYWILRGALNWAKLILIEDAKFSATDDLTEPWNTPLMETRLDEYAKDSKIQTNSVDAILSGYIVDAQSKFNIIRLATNGKINSNNVEIFARLLRDLDLPSHLSLVFGTALANQQKWSVHEDKLISGTIGFSNLNDLLALPGFNNKILRLLEEHIIILPRITKTNINTASLSVIAAELDIAYTDARNLVAMRENAIFLDTSDFVSRTLQLGLKVQSRNITVKSDFFIILGNVKINKSLIQKKCLIERTPESAYLIWLKDV